jgi:hypothetical protein
LARGHCEVPWLEKPRLEGTSRSRKLSRSNFEVKKTCEHLGATWLARTLRTLETLDKSARGHFKVTSKTLGSRELDSRPLQGCFETTWLEKLDSRPLGGHLARLACLGSAWLDSASLNFARLGSAQPGPASLDPRGLTQLGLCRNCSKKLLKKTIRENCLGATELCLP